MSLEERTLVIRNLNSQHVTRPILEELFNQAGPVLNVVLRSDFAYIEFGHKCSVAYALALMNGIHLFGQEMHLSPKIPEESVFQYVNSMNAFNYAMASNPNFFQQFLPNNTSHQNSRHNSYENNPRYERREPNRREELSNYDEKRFNSSFYDYDRTQNTDRYHHNNHHNSYHNNRNDRRHSPYNPSNRGSHRESYRDYDQRQKPQYSRPRSYH